MIKETVSNSIISKTIQKYLGRLQHIGIKSLHKIQSNLYLSYHVSYITNNNLILHQDINIILVLSMK